jgi:hypothetical protein
LAEKGKFTFATFHENLFVFNLPHYDGGNNGYLVQSGDGFEANWPSQ